MPSFAIAGGAAHLVPADLKSALIANRQAHENWEDLTPLARNEWICWVISPKKPQTRQNHVARTVSELLEGRRRPCCWAGCPHRSDKPLSASQKFVLSKHSPPKKKSN